MDAMTAWFAARAMPVLLGVVLLAAIGGFVHWRGRPAWSDDIPLPLLHRRTSIALLLLGVVAFAAIAVAIGAEGRLVAFDQRVAARAASWLGGTEMLVLSYLTELGDSDTLTLFGVAIALLLFFTRHRLLAAAWAITVLGSGLMIGAFKNWFMRPRPVHLHGYAEETTWSFPSGHAAGALVFYAMLAYVLMVRLPQRWHTLVWSLAAVLIALIGASRVLLQVHFLSDVCAGFALGLGWLAACVAATEFLRTAHLPKPQEPA